MRVCVPGLYISCPFNKPIHLIQMQPVMNESGNVASQFNSK